MPKITVDMLADPKVQAIIREAVMTIARENDPNATLREAGGDNCYQEARREVGLPPAPSPSANHEIDALLGELDTLYSATQSLVEAITPAMLIQPEENAAGATPRPQTSPLIGRIEVARSMTRQVTEILHAARNRVAL